MEQTERHYSNNSQKYLAVNGIFIAYEITHHCKGKRAGYLIGSQWAQIPLTNTVEHVWLLLIIG
jgi:hypothetical protein